MTRVRGLVGAVAAGMALMVVGASPALADTLDQEAPVTAGGAGYSAWLWNTQTMAQPFTAGMSGELTSVTVNVSRFDGNPVDTNLTVAVYGIDNGAPAGTPLASHTFNGPEVMQFPTGRVLNTVNVPFTNPATITAGTDYAIVVSTTDPAVAYHWYVGDFGTRYSMGSGNPTYSNAADWWVWTPYPLAFQTFVNGGGHGGGAGANDPSGTGGAGRNTFPLTLQAQGGPSAVEAEAEVDPGWVQLPGVGATGKSDRAFLGWSTSPDFPVERARTQVANGWGAIDEVIDGHRMILIPAGGFTEVTGPTKLYAIWG